MIVLRFTLEKPADIYNRREHLISDKKFEPNKSGSAEHIIENEHRIGVENFELIFTGTNRNRLNVLESPHIY